MDRLNLPKSFKSLYFAAITRAITMCTYLLKALLDYLLNLIPCNFCEFTRYKIMYLFRIR